MSLVSATIVPSWLFWSCACFPIEVLYHSLAGEAILLTRNGSYLKGKHLMASNSKDEQEFHTGTEGKGFVLDNRSSPGPRNSPLVGQLLWGASQRDTKGIRKQRSGKVAVKMPHCHRLTEFLNMVCSETASESPVGFVSKE